MVEIKARDVGARLKSVGSGIRGAILFGSDGGMVRENALKIATQIVPDVKDPFQVVRLTPKDLVDHPSLLCDEMAAISMLGGRRLVWLEGVDRSTNAAVKLAQTAIGDGFLLVSAGHARKTDATVKAFIKASDMIAVPCYADEGRSLIDLIQSVLSENGLTATNDAVRYLMDHLGSDRMVSRSELDKLVLYMGPEMEPTDSSQKAAPRQVTLEDAQKNIGDASAFTLGEIATAVTAGHISALEKGLARASMMGENPVAILRVVSTRFMKFHMARGAVDRGSRPAEVVKKMGVFWKEADSFSAQLQKWTLPKIGRALDILLQAEETCKTTGNPADIICARALLSIARAVS